MKKVIKLFIIIFLFVLFLDVVNAKTPENFINETVSLYDKEYTAFNTAQTPKSGAGESNLANIGKKQELSCDKIKELTNPIWKWLMIIGPTLALVLGVLDLLKAVASGDDKTVKKSMSDFGKRLGLAALLLMLPTIVKLIIGLVEFGDLTICL